MKWPLLALTVVLGCGSDLNPAGLPPIDGYTSWPSLTVQGEVPGHGDTIRVIYVNALGRTYRHAGGYVVGSVIVKEIYERTGQGQKGNLLTAEVMRKVGAGAALGTPVEDGWVFSEKQTEGETHSSVCVGCHRQAPFDGAWYDYGE